MRKIQNPKRLAREARAAADRMGQTLLDLGRRLDVERIGRAASAILAARAQGGRVHVMGLGKPASVARYAAASLASIGTPAYFLDAAEALHGSAGQIVKGDVVIAVSNSGATPESFRAARLARALGATVIAVTAEARSPLARAAHHLLAVRVDREGDSLDLPPRASILAQLFVLNVLSVTLQEASGLTAADFRRFHPGGALGRPPKQRRSGERA